MENTLTTNNTELNYDIFNALNLHHPYLGEAYSNTGWNPLGENFSLDISFIEKYLENARFKPEDKAPAFLEKDPKKVYEAFQTASKNNKDMISTLKNRLEKGEFNDVKGANISPQVKDILFFLECRQKMLDVSIKQLVTNKTDALKAFKNINSINRKLSQLLEEAYMEKFNKNVALGNMLLEAQLQNLHQKQPSTHSNIFKQLLEKSALFDPNPMFTPEQRQQQAKTFLDNITEAFQSLENNMSSITQAMANDIISTISQQPTQQQTQQQPEIPFKMSSLESQTPQTTTRDNSSQNRQRQNDRTNSNDRSRQH